MRIIEANWLPGKSYLVRRLTFDRLHNNLEVRPLNAIDKQVLCLELRNFLWDEERFREGDDNKAFLINRLDIYERLFIVWASRFLQNFVKTTREVFHVEVEYRNSLFSRLDFQAEGLLIFTQNIAFERKSQISKACFRADLALRHSKLVSLL